jgi:hypothetical protein
MAGAPSLLTCTSGRPHDTGNLDAVRALIKGEGHLPQMKIAQMLGIHDETVKRILRDELNMVKLPFKWVPHALDSSQKAVRIQVSREPLDFRESRTEACRMSALGMKRGCTWLILGHPCGSVPTSRGLSKFDAQLCLRNACFGSIFLGQVLVQW